MSVSGETRVIMVTDHADGKSGTGWLTLISHYMPRIRATPEHDNNIYIIQYDKVPPTLAINRLKLSPSSLRSNNSPRGICPLVWNIKSEGPISHLCSLIITALRRRGQWTSHRRSSHTGGLIKYIIVLYKWQLHSLLHNVERTIVNLMML